MFACVRASDFCNSNIPEFLLKKYSDFNLLRALNISREKTFRVPNLLLLKEEILLKRIAEIIYANVIRLPFAQSHKSQVRRR